MGRSVATIISYCTNDFRFIGKCIEEVSKFSDQIIISVCDHFFDGTPENRSLLEATYDSHPGCQFVEFAYLPHRIYSPHHSIGPNDPDWPIFWAATTRYVGWHYIRPEINYVLFLDSDEILEGDQFNAWLKFGKYFMYDAMRLAAYLYAMKPMLRAKKVVNLPLFVKKETLSSLTLINELERIGAYLSHPGPKREEIVGLHGLPMVHHYSWVRTKEECLQKAKTWGHRNDADWPAIIEETFSGKGDRYFGMDHVFEEVPAYFDPFQGRVQQKPCCSSLNHSCSQFDSPTVAASNKRRGVQRKNVIKIDDRDLFRKGVELALL